MASFQLAVSLNDLSKSYTHMASMGYIPQLIFPPNFIFRLIPEILPQTSNTCSPLPFRMLASDS